MESQQSPAGNGNAMGAYPPGYDLYSMPFNTQHSMMNQSMNNQRQSNHSSIFPTHITQAMDMDKNKDMLPSEIRKSYRSGPPGSNLFVFHIPGAWNDADLLSHFTPYGKVLSAQIQLDRTGISRGYGFVSYTDPTAAVAASKALNGYRTCGKRLKVGLKNGDINAATMAINMNADNSSQLCYFTNEIQNNKKDTSKDITSSSIASNHLLSSPPLLASQVSHNSAANSTGPSNSNDLYNVAHNSLNKTSRPDLIHSNVMAGDRFSMASPLPCINPMTSYPGYPYQGMNNNTNSNYSPYQMSMFPNNMYNSHVDYQNEISHLSSPLSPLSPGISPFANNNSHSDNNSDFYLPSSSANNNNVYLTSSPPNSPTSPTSPISPISPTSPITTQAPQNVIKTNASPLISAPTVDSYSAALRNSGLEDSHSKSIFDDFPNVPASYGNCSSSNLYDDFHIVNSAANFVFDQKK